MGIFEKFKFWGKHDNFDDLKLDSSLDMEPSTNLPNSDMMLNGLPKQEQPVQPVQSFNLQKNQNNEQIIQLISSKLDTLIAKMDNMNQRIANIERIAQDAQQQ
jgi:hypothetical protein